MHTINRRIGRFLPSRVYARWKWTVRFGLSALPLILFLSGAMEYYFSPKRFESRAVFSFLGDRTPAQVATLLKSGKVVDRAIAALDLKEKLGVSSDTAVEMVSAMVKTKVIRGTNEIELRVTASKSDMARDLADGLVRSLDEQEKSVALVAINHRIATAESFVSTAEEEAAARRQDLVRLISVRGSEAADPVSRLDLDAARADWDHAYQRVLDGRSRIADDRRELQALGTWVEIHTVPVISDHSVGRVTEETLGGLLLQVLGIGLGFALLAPYVLELAFPVRSRRIRAPRGEWSDFPGIPENI